MKAPVFAFLIIALLFASCKDSNTTENESDIESVSEERVNSENKTDQEVNTNSEGTPNDNDVSDSKIDPKTSNTDSKTDNTNEETLNTKLSGQFIKIGEEIDNSCACYCLNINYSETTELCLTPSKVFINTRMVKSSNQITKLYFVNASSKNTGGKEIPWEKFDKNTPIATITTNSNGEIELDWLGFTINGDLAIDYAILGKKSLEGNYKKK
jgi:hypothetical protein